MSENDRKVVLTYPTHFFSSIVNLVYNLFSNSPRNLTVYLTRVNATGMEVLESSAAAETAYKMLMNVKENVSQE